MQPISLMRHVVSCFRPVYSTDGTSQDLTGFVQVYSGVRCFIQPASASLQFWYQQRGTTMTHTIYTTAVQNVFKREDVFLDAWGNQYHLLADPINALQSGVYIQLDCEQYPEDAKQRLDMEEV
jgi:hypothetical protein